MKIQELYVKEVMTLIASLDLQCSLIGRTYAKRMNGFRIAMFFRPWVKDRILDEMLIESQAILRVMNEMGELREKLLESTGLDDDMQPISLKDLIAKQVTNS